MRRLIAAAAVLTLATAVPALAQGRVRGVVQDVDGEPIRGATIRASHPDAGTNPTSTTDDGGRFVLQGLRVEPDWQLTVEAPGFLAIEVTVSALNDMFNRRRPSTFTLLRDEGPAPGIIARNIFERLRQANELRNAGQYDQAIDAYLSIQADNATLTSLNLVLAETYRLKADRESDSQVRRTLLEQARQAYGKLLETDGPHDRASAELAEVEASLNALQ